MFDFPRFDSSFNMKSIVMNRQRLHEVNVYSSELSKCLHRSCRHHGSALYSSDAATFYARMHTMDAFNCPLVSPRKSNLICIGSVLTLTEAHKYYRYHGHRQ